MVIAVHGGAGRRPRDRPVDADGSRADLARAVEAGWVDHPGVTQFARRCKGGFPERVTISGDTHGHLWSVGLPLGFDGPVCIGARAGGMLVPDEGAESSPGQVNISVRHTGPCGLVLLAGRAPAARRDGARRRGRPRAAG